MQMIETENLTKNYGKARGIVELNLSVAEGEFFGCIGPNGAGKSTTIRTLLGLISPSSGSASVLGCAVDKRHGAYRRDVGYLPSEAMFYGGMRVRELLRFSAGLRGRDCEAEARRLCERLDLDVEKRIEELSLGNRKKVGIVCAMQHNPKLYILDEPTSGLDPLMQREFFDLLREKQHDGATIFLSSHVLSEIQHHCDRAAIIKEGRLIACDRVEALARTGARRVTLHGVTALPDGIEGRSVNVSPDAVSFLYQGEMPALLASLVGLPLTDLTITEPDLEEVFLHFYQKEAS